MSEIHYVVGNATEPLSNGNKIIVHCCNDRGAWGAGFVLALSEKWPGPEYAYRHEPTYMLGHVRYVEVADDIVVANLIGQHGTVQPDCKRPVRYDAISDGFDDIAKVALHDRASVHMPRIGCGLAGGDWAIIERLIDESFIQRGIHVFVYDLKET